MAVTIKRKTQGTAVINFIGAAVNIGLNFIFIPRYGIFGAAYAIIIFLLIGVQVLLEQMEKYIILKNPNQVFGIDMN